MRIDSPTIVGNLTVQGTLSSNNSAIFTALSVVALSSVVNYAPIIINGSNSQSLFQSIQNTTPGVSASTDISVYNDTGNYLDMGIASSTYNGNLFGPKFNIVGAGDSYLYTTANNLVLGTSLSSNTFTNDIVMFTGGTLSGSNAVGGNERMRITTGGNVGIGTASPNSALTVVGNVSASGNIYTSGLSASTTFSPPRYTTTLTPAISAATNGNVIYNTTQGNLNTYNSAQSAWGIVVNSDYVQNISTLTQAQYNALVGGPVATTFYIITDAPSSGTNVANIATKTANYTITSSDYCINSTATIPTGITLPSAIGLAGYIFIIKNSGTSTVTVSAAAGEFIDATSTVSLSTRYSSVRVQSLGTSTGYIIT